MGAYLTVPNTEKSSSNEANEYLEIGASSMQGWRISQEDAHNCLLEFDQNTSLFSVYDGHGGAEVAIYCAEKLPPFLKELESYKNGDYGQALKDAFLGFDKTLLDEDVIEELKRLAEKNPNRDSDIAEDEEEEDLMELCQEGALPLQQVLEKYKGCAAARFPQLNRVKQDEAGASGSGVSKPMSPLLRGRRSIHSNLNQLGETDKVAGDVGCGPSSSTSSVTVPTAKAASQSMPDLGIGDSCVSSSCGKSDGSIVNSTAIVEEEPKVISSKPSVNEAVSMSDINGTASPVGMPDSSSSDAVKSTDSEVAVPVKTKVQNGDITSSSALASSMAAEGNGVVSSNSSVSKVNDKAAPGIAPSRPKSSSGSGGISSSITSSSKGGPALNPKVHGQGDIDDSSSDDDVDFHAEEENSSTEDGEEDCEAIDDETDEDENEEGEETEDEEEGILDDDETAFCRNMIEEPGKDSGCTAVVALVNGRDLYVANAGDSRCVVCRNGKAIEMSLDHKPEDEEESDRIVKAGGKVTLDGRVNGGLNLSRAIGDHAYKMNQELPAEKQMISALPDVRKLIISPGDEFMILACDGIWNFMSSDDVVEFVKKRLDDGCEKLSQICEELFDYCLAPNTMGDGTGCDNMTAVLVRFKSGLQKLPTKISAESEAVPVSATSPKKRATPTSAEAAQNNIATETTDSSEPAAKKRPASPSRSEELITSGASASNESSSSASLEQNACKRLKTDNEATDSADSKAAEAGSSQDEDVSMSTAIISSSSASESAAIVTTAESETITTATTSTT